MAFVNEYISEEDIRKYRLEQDFLKRNPQYSEIPPTFKPEWTIDREKGVTLRLKKRANPVFEGESYIEFELKFDENKFLFKLVYGEGCSSSLKDSPYLVVWDLVSLQSPENADKEIINQANALLKAGLMVYGYDGARKQIPNTIVKFNF